MITNTMTEVDMGYIHAVFKSLADTIVTASELPKQMEAIRSDMNGLTADLERTKARNVELDTLLADTRRQRDEAEQALSQIKSQLQNVTYDLDKTIGDANDLQRRLAQAQTDLEQARKERDDYGLKHMEAEDRATQAEAKLKKLREALGMAEVETKASAGQTTSDVVPVVSSGPTTPAMTEQAPPPVQTAGEAMRIYPGDVGYDKFLAHSYDSNRGEWYHYSTDI